MDPDRLVQAGHFADQPLDGDRVIQIFGPFDPVTFGQFQRGGRIAILAVQIAGREANKDLPLSDIRPLSLN